MKKNRILYITEHFPPLSGGMSVSCARQVDGLRGRGHVVDVCIFSPGKRVKAPMAETGSQQDNASPEAAIMLPMSSVVEGGENRFFQLSGNYGYAAQTLWRYVKGESGNRKWDWVVGFGANFPGFVATVFADWLKVRSLVLVRGNDFDRDFFDPRFGYWVKDALSRADVVGSVSAEASGKIRSLFKRKNVQWIPNGIDFESLRLFKRDEETAAKIRKELSGEKKVVRPIIGLFGDLKDKKGIPLWLEALREAELVGRVGILAVGRMEEETSQIIRDPGLTPHSHVIDFCPREDLPAYYSACDYVAIPSVFEGMPNVLLEAMALEKIPIVSDAGAMGEIVKDGETGFIFPAGDWATSAKALERALQLGTKERILMGRKASSEIRKRFPPEKELMLLEKVFSGRLPAGRGGK